MKKKTKAKQSKQLNLMNGEYSISKLADSLVYHTKNQQPT